MSNYANALYAHGLRRDKQGRLASAWRYFVAAGVLGHADAMLCAGYALNHGRGVPKNTDSALEWYRAAARAGNKRAMHNLALLSPNGIDGGIDWFEQVRTFGHAERTAMN